MVVLLLVYVVNTYKGAFKMGRSFENIETISDDIVIENT